MSAGGCFDPGAELVVFHHALQVQYCLVFSFFEVVDEGGEARMVGTRRHPPHNHVGNSLNPHHPDSDGTTHRNPSTVVRVIDEESWETWGIAARWNPQHGWHQPDAHPEHDTPTQTAS